MKIVPLLLLSAVGVLPLLAVKRGDTYDQVIGEKGAPEAKLQAGDTMILNYSDQSIKLKANVVVDVSPKSSSVPRAAPAPAPTPVRSSAPAPAPAAASAEATGEWTTNYAGALAQARQDKTKVFLFFTGSDWCGWCKRLEREILSTAEFQDYAGKNLVLVKLDFPRGIPQSDALKAQNEQLSRRYQIQGYPTVIVLDSKGRPIGQLGYQEGGPGPFIDVLKAF